MTEKQLREARKRRRKIYNRTKRVSQVQTAREFGISRQRVGQICAMVEAELKAGENQ